MEPSQTNIFDAIKSLKKVKKTKELAESLQPVLYTLALSVDTGDAAHELWRNIITEQLKKETSSLHRKSEARGH